MKQIIADIQHDLKLASTLKMKESAQSFFKEPIDNYGVKSPIVKEISKKYYKLLKGESKATIFELCQLLWESGKIEEAFIACHWSHHVHKNYVPNDLVIFKKWIANYITNWATCDTFCNHTMGDFLMMYPNIIDEIKSWVYSENRWLKRAAAVSLIIPAKKGLFKDDIFEIATLLMYDNDDMVQKGYGWMLKVASLPYQKEVFNFVIKYKDTMPRTALRYAIEKMPSDLKKEAMKR